MDQEIFDMTHPLVDHSTAFVSALNTTNNLFDMIHPFVDRSIELVRTLHVAEEPVYVVMRVFECIRIEFESLLLV